MKIHISGQQEEESLSSQSPCMDSKKADYVRGHLSFNIVLHVTLVCWPCDHL